MMLDQYVARPTISSRNNKITDQIKVEKSDLLTGYGIVRAIPGPVFSIGSFTGGMALEKEGKHRQLLGCLIGSVAIFLPSVLLVLFFFPVWQNLKKYIVILRALEGINAVVVGVMWAAVIYLIREIPISAGIPTGIMSLVIITTTFLLLRYTKIPAPILVLSTVFFGWIF